jgi:hypothetical protein
MEIKPYNTQYYGTLSFWWQLHGWPAIPETSLPKTGIVVEVEGKPVVAGFLYNTDSNIAWLEMVVGNPLCDKIVRSNALDILIPALLAEAHKLGKSIVFSSLEHPALLERYKKFGAVEADTNITNVIWRL